VVNEQRYETGWCTTVQIHVCMEEVDVFSFIHNALVTLDNISFVPFLHDCVAPMLLQIQHQIHSAHSGRKQDLTPTIQNTRSRTRCHLKPFNLMMCI
jgi:hypothetical protein